MTDEQKRDYIASLIRERAGYARYGNGAGVADVDAELERIGHSGRPPQERAVKRGPGRPPKPRTEL